MEGGSRRGVGGEDGLVMEKLCKMRKDCTKKFVIKKRKKDSLRKAMEMSTLHRKLRVLLGEAIREVTQMSLV